ncbi:MAG: chromosomal replication initiator protein DnaA [Sedimentisphaerales bacterium]|nr:chromosomal replication initiator protein DnaA [Sedimentisphaerales bacterium]
MAGWYLEKGFGCHSDRTGLKLLAGVFMMQGTITEDIKKLASEQVSSINDVLAGKIGMQKYRIWFQNSTNMTLTEGYLKIGAANPFISSWIENHFSGEIIDSVRTVTGTEIKLIFTIDPQLNGSQSRLRLDAQDSESALQAGRFREKPKRVKLSELNQNKKLKLGLDTFVVGSSNELAYNAAKLIVNEDKSPFNPLFVHGGYGVGKTHLLQGICNAMFDKRSQANWMYLSAEDFANQFVLALKTKKLESFRNRMRQTDLLAIDDIHFLASKPSMQEEFLHTFNTIDLAGKQIVLASDAHPKQISQLSDKLVNRFVSGMVVKIEPPDLDMRCRICRQFLQRLNRPVEVSDSVIQYIAENLITNVRELEGAVLKVIAFSSLKSEQVSLSMAKAVLAEHLERCDPIVHVSDIESAVASFFGITPANLHSPKKNRTVALARHLSMYLTRKHTRMSSSEIGRVMGGKNHATVLLACRKVDDMIERNIDIHWESPAGNKISKAKAVITQLEKSISR